MRSVRRWLIVCGAMGLSWVWVWQPALYGDKGWHEKERLQQLLQEQHQRAVYWREQRMDMEKQVKMMREERSNRSKVSGDASP